MAGLFDWQNGNPTDPWTPSPDAWVYVSASSFKIVDKDVRSRFGVGTRVKYNDGSVDYGTVIASALSGSDTLVTLAPNSDFAIANAALSGCYYSYGNPPDYPGSFAWTPTFTNMTVVGSATYAGRFSIHHHHVKIWIAAIGSTSLASTAGTTYCDNLPFTVARADTLTVTNDAGANIGIGLFQAGTTRAFMPTWGASGLNFYPSGWFEIA